MGKTQKTDTGGACTQLQPHPSQEEAPLKAKANLETIKDVNSKLILSCLHHKNSSRAELSDLTGLSRSAVTIITRQLMEQGQIMEIGTESTPLGRAPVLLSLVKDYRYALGILFHRREIAVCVVNLKLESIGTRRCGIGQFSSPEAATDWAYREGISILDSHQIPRERCIGIGISSPGPLSSISGDIFTPPNFPLFHHFNPVEYLGSKCAYPVSLNNAPVPMAVYELQSRYPAAHNSLFVVVDNGIGAAILQNGRIYPGTYGFSGEFGHIRVEPDGIPCSCGSHGCLECYATKKAILEKFGLASYESMVDDAYRGDGSALAILDYIAKYFASAIISTVNLLDLEGVVIGGDFNYRQKLLFSRIQELVNQSVIRPDAYPVKVTSSAISRENDLAYVASIVIQRYFEP